jgi:phosphatidylglycerol:prolipoprotein diacylglycerol transferase
MDVLTHYLIIPPFNPIAFSLGPLTVHWYGLMYVIGIFIAWKVGDYLLTHYKNGITPKILDDSIVYVIIGIVVGGRLGHVLFYDPGMFLRNPLEVFMTWHGGMSFHGGVLGVILAVVLYCRKVKAPFFALMDIYACVVPIGLFFGRIGNFINGELWGRVTDVPWAVILPYPDHQPRHPSQLYEAALEGVVLFIITLLCWTRTDLRHKRGRLVGVFSLGYALARSFCELFREPDAFILGPITIGQLLSIPLLGIGWFLLRRPVDKNDESIYPTK